MLLYYIRHGDPVYDPDSLTKLGERQAEAAAKRLALHGLDRIYASTSNRALCTAKPTAEMLNMEVVPLDFTSEVYTWDEFTIGLGENKHWIFEDAEMRKLFHQPDVRALGENWYEHPAFADHDFGKGIQRIYRESDRFFESLGYQHLDHTGCYKVMKHSDERIALFAHQGFGLAFLSCLLDIPYPQFTTHFDMCHTGITVIDFPEEDGYAIPCVRMLSSDGHIYREGLPTKYSNKFYI